MKMNCEPCSSSGEKKKATWLADESVPMCGSCRNYYRYDFDKFKKINKES